ncbi:GntR family transcriptional regulator [Pseudomonas sp. Q11]|uniref:GntR family transcriptional regulator n=1 Tax=Pseudomonas sp. Q11 TaxID=2968470 RepID=UPI00210E1BD1|nr:GntR family transcriptional regulator [Pseudomonas sp. Q11]MCQ6258296.1 GntR family transcriptional regulator [Pseudomonas sp. Q11]
MESLEYNTAPSAEGRSSGKTALRNRDVDEIVLRAVATLEEDIVLGYLHPRERLIEDDLRERFDLKRHVVRQVLTELERKGLVERKKNFGAVVKFHTVAEVMNLYEVRDILESSAAQRIPLPLAPERLDTLVAIQRAHDGAVARTDLRAVFRANMAFHKALFAATENLELADVIEDFAQRTNAIRSSSTVIPEHLEQSRKEHWEIIEALRSGDRDALVALCRHHLTPARDHYIERYRMLYRDKGTADATRAASVSGARQETP